MTSPCDAVGESALPLRRSHWQAWVLEWAQDWNGCLTVRLPGGRFVIVLISNSLSYYSQGCCDSLSHAGFIFPSVTMVTKSDEAMKESGILTAKGHDRQHISPKPIIVCRLSWFDWRHLEGGELQCKQAMAVCVILAVLCSEKPKKEQKKPTVTFPLFRSSTLQHRNELLPPHWSVCFWLFIDNTTVLLCLILKDGLISH